MFDSRYEVYLADTAQSRAWHHQVRYQVFCVERGFESPERFHDGQEHDRWDPHADHFVVCDRWSGASVAAMRIVRPTEDGLPVEQLGCISGRLPTAVGRDQVAEVSRICIPRDASAGLRPRIRAVQQRSEPEILLGLMRAMHRYSRDHGVQHFYMLVTPAFARLLQRLGLHCTRVGEFVEHRGLRAPYLVDVEASWQAVASRSAKVAAMLGRHYLAYVSHAALQPLRLGHAAKGAGRGVQRVAA
jgi:N-acyl amino acid synthase of PEP-CTERM/exosortase system